MFFGQPGVSNVSRAKDAPRVPAAVAQAAFALSKLGDVAPKPIKTSKGWHVVQKTGYKPAFKQEFAAVKNSIQNRLFKIKKREAMEAYVNDLRNKATITIDEAALSEVGRKGKGPRAPERLKAPGLGKPLNRKEKP